MALTKNDLGKIGQVINKRIIEERKYNKKLSDDQRDKIIAYVKVRYDDHSNQIKDIKSELKMINGKLTALERKIDQIKEMETDDINRAYEEIEAIKNKVLIMEKKLAMLKR